MWVDRHVGMTERGFKMTAPRRRAAPVPTIAAKDLTKGAAGAQWRS
jgi:hypothetical protein